jgi:hypothetical protein
MPNLAHVVQQLRKERHQAQRRVEQLDEALKTLTGVGALRGTTTNTAVLRLRGAKRRMMSAASRKRIAKQWEKTTLSRETSSFVAQSLRPCSGQRADRGPILCQ